MPSFTAAVEAWVLESEEVLETVIREAGEDFITEAGKPKFQGGNMPVITSFLRNSMASDINGSGNFSTVSPPKDGVLSGDRSGDVILMLQRMKLGDIFHVAWIAVYARRVNSGFTGADKLGRVFSQRGAHFVEMAADMWQSFIDAAVARNKR